MKAELKAEIMEELKFQLENESKQDQEIVSLKEQISRLESINAASRYPSSFENNITHKNQPFSDNVSTRSAVPTSCGDLGWRLGHSLDGLYLIQREDNRRIEIVNCEFRLPSYSNIFYSSIKILEIIIILFQTNI